MRIIGDDKKKEALEQLAFSYRSEYLKNFDFGVVSYYWKDENGTMVLDRTERMSFGTGDIISETATWLEQKFARLDTDEPLTVELSVSKGGEAYASKQIQLDCLREKELQQIGIVMNHNLQVSLVLKNDSNQTHSIPVAFLTE
jgi:hypothetical protein